MVRSGATLFACAAVAVLFIALLPSGTQASHGQFLPELRSPGVGTAIHLAVAPEHNYSVDYRFIGSGSVLAGHFEDRSVAYVDVRDSFGEGNHTFRSAYDLTTGLLLGRGHNWSFAYSWPTADLGPLETVHETHSFGGRGPSADWFLPETLLWGRSFWPGETWTVHEMRPYCGGGSSSEVQTLGDYNGSGFENITVQVVRHCAFSTGSQTLEWTLRFDGAPGVVADERILKSTYTDQDNESTVYTREVPATIVDEGASEGFGFEGRGEARFWADRDQTMRYAVGDDLFPADPEPHGVFDLREAGELALNVDDEAVRVFLAGAESPLLSGAGMDLFAGGKVTWWFMFADGDERELHVTLEGLKLPGQALLVTEETARLHDGSWWRDLTLYEGETAYVGDLARRTDAYHEANGLSPAGYSWYAHGHGVAPEFSADATDPTVYPLSSRSERVSVDSSTGIVIGQSRSGSMIGL